MRGDAQPLIKFFEGSDKRFVIPLYQRNYDWQEKQCRQLFNDLIKVHREQKASHFFGSIVSQIFNNYDQYIIDGQQRITTVSLILTALVNGAKAGDIKFRNEGLPIKIYECFLVDKYKEAERKIKLKPVNKDMQAFDALVCDAPKDFVLTSNVTRNYRFFYEQIVKSGLMGDDIYRSIEKLVIINILLDPQDDPQLIFESLNSTGLDLSEADKIRNYLLMSVPVEEQERLYRDYWCRIEENAAPNTTAFIRDFLTAKTLQIGKASDIYFLFKDYTESHHYSRAEVLAQMEADSALYKNILSARTGMHKTNQRLKHLNSIDASVLNPFYLSFFNHARDHAFSDDVCASVLSTIESYMARRIICNSATNALNKVFARLHHDVVAKQDGDSSGNLYVSILNYTLSRKTESAAFPNDEVFRAGFATRQLYRITPANRNFILERLENRDCKETHDVARLLSEKAATIEHIMPQTLSTEWKQELGSDYERVHEQYLHTMANLTLTGYNSEYSNLSFLKKKTLPNGFCDGTYRLSSFLRKDSVTRWTETEILARQKELFEICLQLWPMPVSDYTPNENQVESAALDEEVNFTNRKLCGYTFLGTHNDVKTWAEMLMQVLRRCLQENEAAVRWCCDNNKYNMATVANAKGYHYHREFSKDLYVRACSSTATKIWTLQSVLKECSIPLSELTFDFRPNVLSTDSETEEQVDE